MLTRKSSIGIAICAGAAALLVGGWSLRTAEAQNGNQSAPLCKISPVQAIKIALKKVPGRPLQANFEYDEGQWVYGVMIVNGKTLKEVQIDPVTGKVGATETVTPDEEAKEIKDSLMKAIDGKASAVKKNEKKEEKEEKEEKESDEKEEKDEKKEKPAQQ